MIYFLKIDNPSKSKNYDKGLLFEKLCKELISSLGYKDIDMRVFKDNLEYDITARSKLNEYKLIGEAKAYQSKIKDEIMVFIAKMLVHWGEDKNTAGLFISTSELTSPIAGQIKSIKDQGYNLIHICGNDVFRYLSENMNLPNFQLISKSAMDLTGLNTGETKFLVTDRGYFYIQLLIESGNTLPTKFCIFDRNGNLIKDNDFIKCVKEEIEILESLTHYETHDTAKTQVANEKEIISSFLGVLYGSQWFEYQFPTPPDKFIGREIIINKFVEYIDDVRTDRDKFTTYQILSRSGVGKSSLTIKLNDVINSAGDFGVVIDSRNIRSELDVLEVFHLLIKNYNEKSKDKINYPVSITELIDSIQVLNNKLSASKHVAIIFLDQFESVFSKQSIYNLLLDTITECNSVSSKIVFVISRKNDQPTTYDESAQIDISKLTNISKNIKLSDFNYEESNELISKLSSELGKPIIKELKEQILEISSGFPWLLKKYCSHILTLSRKGHSQKDIVINGMQLENLFEEELDSLDEILNEFFYRLIYFLPATYYEINEKFDDSDLQYKLRALQNEHRLIRLTGKTYDTYNDVLKEYVKTGNILINKKYIFRLNHTSVLPLFKEMAEKEFSSIDDIHKKAKRKYSKGTLYIKLNELRRLELIEGSNSKFKINPIALKSLTDGSFDNYLNAILKRNILTKKLIDKLYIVKTLTLNDVREILISEMPYIEASEKVWTTYSRHYCTWLKVAGICQFRNNKLSLTDQKGDSLVIKGENNYFPTVYLTQVERFIEVCSHHDGLIPLSEIAKEMNRKSLNGIAAAADFLGLIKVHYRGVIEISEIGITFNAMSKNERIVYVREVFGNLEYVSEYLTRINSGEDSEQVFIETVQSMGYGEDWTTGTVQWKHKLLRNWLLYCKIVKIKRK